MTVKTSLLTKDISLTLDKYVSSVGVTIGFSWSMYAAVLFPRVSV